MAASVCIFAAGAGQAATRDAVHGSLIQEPDPGQFFDIDFRSHLVISADGSALDADGMVRFRIEVPSTTAYFTGRPDCVIATGNTAFVGGDVTDVSENFRDGDGNPVFPRFLVQAFDDDARAGGNDLAIVMLGVASVGSETPTCGTVPIAFFFTGFDTQGNLVIHDAELD